mmetsp:Transcript_18434/g.23360  ORF Transcript_18434/g.23360 Transcript_18434/m.23360 type:complete len:294 (-) Transcript_18434:53-934(-)
MFAKLRGKEKKKSAPRQEPMDERDRQIEREKQVRQIHKMLVPRPKELLMSPRAIVKYGTVSMKVIKGKKPRKLRFLFLFNDVLLITKRESKSSFRLRFYISLRSSHKVQDIKGEGKYAGELQLICPKKSFSFIAKNQQQKREWIEALTGSIEGKFDLYSKRPPDTPPTEKKNDTKVEKEEPTVETKTEIQIEEKQTFNFGSFDISDFMDDDDDDNFLNDIEELTLGGQTAGETLEFEESEEESEEYDEESDEAQSEGNTEAVEEGETQNVFLSASEESVEEVPVEKQKIEDAE